MTMTEVQDRSSVQEDEDDELLTPREKRPKPESDKDLDDVFTSDYNRKSPNDDFSPRKTERSYSTNSSNESDVKPDISNVPNMFTVSCTATSLPLPSLINTPGQTSYSIDPFDPYNSLSKQYHNASNLLQNITKTPYFDSTGKYVENSNTSSSTNNNNNSPTGKYFDNKYFSGSQQSDFSSIIGRNAVTTSNYSFGASNVLPSGFSSQPLPTKSPLSQFPGSGFLSITGSYPSLGSNPGTTFNAPCFTKFGSSDTLNNNYIYPPNLFKSTYSSSQGSTQIYPPSFGNNGIFPPTINSSLLTGESGPNVSSYNQSASPFSPTIPLMGNSTHSQPLNSSSSSSFENRINFQNDSNYNPPYLDIDQHEQVHYNTVDKYQRPSRKTKPQNGVKKPIKSKKSLPSDPDHTYERIFIWDLDETIILFHSLITGEFASKFGKDPSSVSTVGFRLEEMIYHISSTQLFFSDLEECDQVHIDDISTDDNGQDLSDYNFETDGFHSNSTSSVLQFPAAGRRGVDWNRKLAFRYRRIKELYGSYRNNLDDLLGPGKREQWMPLRIDLENISDAWHTLAIKCINTINRRSNSLNVLVTSSHLIPTLAKCILFDLSSVFPIENIYSASKDGKEACFQRVQSRFGRKCTYVVIGNGKSEEFPSKQLGIPFWRVTNHGDLVNLHHALELGHL